MRPWPHQSSLSLAACRRRLLLRIPHHLCCWAFRDARRLAAWRGVSPAPPASCDAQLLCFACGWLLLLLLRIPRLLTASRDAREPAHLPRSTRLRSRGLWATLAASLRPAGPSRMPPSARLRSGRLWAVPAASPSFRRSLPGSPPWTRMPRIDRPSARSRLRMPSPGRQCARIPRRECRATTHAV